MQITPQIAQELCDTFEREGVAASYALIASPDERFVSPGAFQGLQAQGKIPAGVDWERLREARVLEEFNAGELPDEMIFVNALQTLAQKKETVI